MICCVRSAILAARSVGSASASSKPFVCSDWVPPQTAANPCSATRTMLFSGCWAVSVTPPVCVWKRSIVDLGSVAPKRSRLMRAHMRRAARGEVIHLQARIERRLHVGDPRAEREGDLLDRRAALLAEVVAGDRDRVPARDPLGAILEDVGGEAHRGLGGVDVV